MKTAKFKKGDKIKWNSSADSGREMYGIIKKCNCHAPDCKQYHIIANGINYFVDMNNDTIKLHNTKNKSINNLKSKTIK